MQKPITLLLAGGSGRRLWPLSTAERPKYLIQIAGKNTCLIHQAAKMASMISDEILVVCQEAHRENIRTVLEAIPARINYVIEPSSRNTAAAIALGVKNIKQQFGVGTGVLVLPTDHIITRPQILHQAILTIIKHNKIGCSAFGIAQKKEVREKGEQLEYGYIQPGEPIGRKSSIHTVQQFIEKPHQLQHITKEYLINSGIYYLKVEPFLETLAHIAPAYIQADKVEAFMQLPDQSIDVAIMEKYEGLWVYKLPDIGWSDMGSWERLYSASQKNQDGTVHYHIKDDDIHWTYDTGSVIVQVDKGVITLSNSQVEAVLTALM